MKEEMNNSNLVDTSIIPDENTPLATSNRWDKIFDVIDASRKFQAPQATRRFNKTIPFTSDGGTTVLPSKHDTTTEYGHALNFVECFGEHMLYVSNESCWYVWDRHIWIRDTAGQVFNMAAQYGKQYSSELRKFDTSAASTQSGMCKRIQSNAGIKAIVELASHDPRIQTRSEDFDFGSEELNTPAGVVNLRTGKISEPSSRVLVRRSTAIAPDFNASHELWDDFLERAFAGEHGKAKYLQSQFGVTLIGGQPTQQFNYLKGTEVGADGKGITINVGEGCLGLGERGYVTISDRRVFELSNSDRHSTEIAKLQGVRMVISSEIGSNRALDTDKIKGLVAEDTLTGRFMGGNEFEFKPQFMLWILSNHHAKADATDLAFWRRASTVEFNHSTPVSERIPQLQERLLDEEGPAILAWMIRGATDYLTNGIVPPDCVIEALETYLHSVDTVTEWLADCVVFSTDIATNTAIKDSYNRWCKANGATPMGPKKLGDRLEEHGYPRERTTSIRGHRGMEVKYSITL